MRVHVRPRHGCPQPPKETETDLLSAFKRLDTNDDGFISEKELRAVTMNLGAQRNVDVPLGHAARVSRPPSHLSFRQLARALAGAWRMAKSMIMIVAIHLHDCAPCACTCLCACKCDRSVHPGEVMGEEEVKQLIAEFDTDGDGRLNYTEFMKGFNYGHFR